MGHLETFSHYETVTCRPKYVSHVHTATNAIVYSISVCTIFLVTTRFFFIHQRERNGITSQQTLFRPFIFYVLPSVYIFTVIEF
jgi:hypothetical protein